MVIDSIKTNQKLKNCLICGLFWGFIAHGYEFTNLIANHDGISDLYGIGQTDGSGRWALGLIGSFVRRIVSNNYAIPWVNGIVSIVLIALSSYLVCEILQIEQIYMVRLVSIVMVVFPAVTATFSCMFTAPYYFVGLLCACFGVWLTKKRKIWAWLLACISICFSVGIYQAYISVTVVLIWCELFLEVAQPERYNRKEFLKTIFTYIIILGSSMGLYAVCSKISRLFNESEFSTGFQTMFDLNVFSIWRGIKGAYSTAIGIAFRDYYGLTYWQIIQKSILLIWVISVISVLFMMVKRKQWENLVWEIVLLFGFPVALNLINILSDNGVKGSGYINAIMVYSWVFIFICPIFFGNIVDMGQMGKNKKKTFELLKKSICILVMVCAIFYAYVDNIAYFEMNIVQKQAELYYNRLITRIQSVKGYDDTSPVAIIGMENLEDDTIADKDYFERIILSGYGFTAEELIQADSWYVYMLHMMGVKWHTIDIDWYAETEEFKDRPSYPAEGSIWMMGDTVVVKMGEVSRKEVTE